MRFPVAVDLQLELRVHCDRVATRERKRRPSFRADLQVRARRQVGVQRRKELNGWHTEHAERVGRIVKFVHWGHPSLSWSFGREAAQIRGSARHHDGRPVLAYGALAIWPRSRGVRGGGGGGAPARRSRPIGSESVHPERYTREGGSAVVERMDAEEMCSNSGADAAAARNVG